MKNLIKSILPHGIVELYRQHYGNKVDADIQVINFQVNNFCNSRCVMCDIWRKNDQENINTSQFKEVLQDPLFKNVQHIGITGGEPTLTKNLAEYFQVAIEALPKVTGLSLITNALLPQQIKTIVKDIADLCKVNDKHFSVMVSLDGVNEVHDLNRGREGNFLKVIEIINWLKEEQIPFSTGTTITKVNIWNMDQVLNFLRNNQIYGRFRVGEFINRLYNNTEGHAKVLRNFNEDEIYQLLLFFSKLEYNYETDENVKNTYRSIKNMLQGGQRLIGCPYKNRKAINLDSHGGMAYCAPKSKVVGNLLENSGEHIYKKNLKVLHEIEKNHCMNCIHDYHSDPTLELKTLLETEKKYKDLIKVSVYNDLKDQFSVNYTNNNPEKYKIFIVGWYGTETVGDKAILGGILDHYSEKYGSENLDIYISSLYPFITERTVYELKVRATVVPVYSEQFFQRASVVDEVIVGGGPLMELDELALIEWSFNLAKKNEKKTTVFGSGIGPLYSDEKKGAVKEILKLADSIYLRDNKSSNFAKELTGRDDILNIGDPAIKYIQKLKKAVNISEVPNKFSCFLRELTSEYFGNLNYEEYISFKEKFEEGLARNIIYLSKKTGLKPHFYAMHNFVIGNDDRDFNYNFVNKYFSNIDVYVEDKLSTVETIVDSMRSSKLNLCMRFHSVVFAETLNSDFFAIDYTSGGKINSYLSERNKLDHMGVMTDIMVDETHLYKKMLQINLV
ncbi:polysaccharide pyruvyl transferase family protein [Paenibacillus anseongense]|uniref:polysaccharide pyruvyl transferase family protein n=1 Tax=Paenibacillus anseongense TaxID=2682845 RepID=UPI002DB5BD38|nr:polysaccharide pyruvyl transferase family protein [Paenibacillus anseongense]MEC0264319.1 polysaccharide pyruvyl transferase family protein [Paenibacillus anseongense]